MLLCICSPLININFCIIPGKKKTPPKSVHLVPPPQDILNHFCYLCVSTQYHFDIYSAELPFTNFEEGIEDSMQFFMANPNLQDFVIQLKRQEDILLNLKIKAHLILQNNT